MSFESYMAKRFIKSKPYKNTVSSPIIKISILSIVIGIVMMIISISSSVGLQKTIESKVSSFFGHISISNFENNSGYFHQLSPLVMVSQNLEILFSCIHQLTEMINLYSEFARKGIVWHLFHL